MFLLTRPTSAKRFHAKDGSRIYRDHRILCHVIFFRCRRRSSVADLAPTFKKNMNTKQTIYIINNTRFSRLNPLNGPKWYTTPYRFIKHTTPKQLSQYPTRSNHIYCITINNKICDRRHINSHDSFFRTTTGVIRAYNYHSPHYPSMKISIFKS